MLIKLQKNFSETLTIESLTQNFKKQRNQQINRNEKTWIILRCMQL